jgi:hypothetical protein
VCAAGLLAQPEIARAMDVATGVEPPAANGPATSESSPDAAAPAASTVQAVEAAPAVKEAAPAPAAPAAVGPAEAQEPPEEPPSVRPPVGWYASEFIAGVSFATAQVTLVWAIVEHDHPATRDRLLIVSAISAGTALVAIGAAGLILSSANSQRASTSAYVGIGTVGVRGTF